MAAAVSRPVFDDIARMTNTFKQVMATGKGPIAPRLTDEQITAIFSYGKEHYQEMSSRENGLYHLRSSETGLARSVTWLKDESEMDFFVHCNKLNKETGGDQPLSESCTGAEKQFSYAFSSSMGMIVLSGGVKCIVSDKMNLAFSSRRLAYALNLQYNCAGNGVAYISNSVAYRMKKKSRVIPEWFSNPPTYKFRFFMEKADNDLFDANPASFPFNKKLKAFHSLLTSIRQLHGNDVAHCDIKPENFLIFEGLEDLELTDFGAAIRKEDFGKRFHQQCTDLYRDPECMKASPYSFEALKALDIWQAALTISFILDTHAVIGLFPIADGTPTRDKLSAMVSTLTPGWYSKNYLDRLRGIYRSYPEIIVPLIALMDRMLHPIGKERPGIDECISVIKTLLPSASPEGMDLKS